MEDCYLLCNISNCRKQLTDKAWVTRCMHVFCLEHGKSTFLVPSHQISCPVCNTLNLKEVDVICCNTNPHEMYLSGVSAEKAQQLCKMSIKLWISQLQSEKSLYLNQANSSANKLQSLRCDARKHYLNMKYNLEHQLSCVQKAYNDIVKKYNETKSELESVKMELFRHQRGYNSLAGRVGGSQDTVLRPATDWLEQQPRDTTQYFSAPSTSSPNFFI